MVVSAVRKVKTKAYSAAEHTRFQQLEAYRENLKKDHRLISYKVFGSEKTRTVSEICRRSASPRTWCQFHYVLTDMFQATSYLEIGTNLGVSGSYLISALMQHGGKLITMEGHPDFCAIARTQFKSLTDQQGFEVIEGMYRLTFPLVMKRDVIFDMAFIDGNHQKEATLSYFNALKPKLADRAILIFDDINWSVEMQEAWEQIKRDPIVNYAVDLFRLGIVVIDKSDRNRNVLFETFMAI